MLNKIIIGISQALDTEFNSESEIYNIYTENVEQGLEEPCFFIFSLNLNSKQLIKNRYKREYFFDIHYFPKEIESCNNDINEITERLMDTLEYITVNGNLVRGTKMHAEIVDNVLHFFINFNMIVIKDINKEDAMENLKVYEKVKG